MSRSILKKTAGIASSTLLSRFFAYIREMLLIQFLGIGEISDAFFIALRVPNSLRKVFAEGALSSVLVPALVHEERQDGTAGMNRLLTLSFILIEAIVIAAIIAIYCFAGQIVFAMAPGSSAIKLQASVQFLKILAPFILFLSSSAVLASALQATHRFLLPGLAPALLNVLYVVFLSLCLYFSSSVATFCWTMIIASAMNFLLHLIVCLHYNFKIAKPNQKTWSGFYLILMQLLPCLLSVGIGEINFWIDSAFASYLESGTLSLLRYAYQFVNIPLGVLATSLSMVLLPYFSKIGHSKQELGNYVSEAIKFVLWMMLPITFVMIICSQQIFETMFFSDKFTMHHVIQAQWCMNAYLLGLTFFALEKILLNAFYALRSSGIATAVATLTIGMNYFMNSWLMNLYGGMGLALATSITAATRIFMFLIILVLYFKIDLSLQQIFKFISRYCLQLITLGLIFAGIIMLCIKIINQFNFNYHCSFWFIDATINNHFFLHSFGYWLWFGPIAAVFFAAIYGTRKRFGISFSYIDEK
ncbi:MAG: murein biosynthesis integral membrane protein MurJ [Candidatus Chromulinivorax sp.]